MFKKSAETKETISQSFCTAAYLYGTVIRRAERKHNSAPRELSSAHCKINLEKFRGGQKELIAEAIDIVGLYYHPSTEETINVMTVYDVNFYNSPKRNS